MRCRSCTARCVDIPSGGFCRFFRRGKDPAPIAEKGLTQELVQRLALIGQPVVTSQGGGATPEKPSGYTVTTIVNLLSTLCRSSPTITHVCAHITVGRGEH